MSVPVDATIMQALADLGAGNQYRPGTTLYEYDQGTGLWLADQANSKVTLLPSAARTATVSTAIQRNPNYNGLALVLNVTVASGTGGVQVILRMNDPVSGTAINLENGQANITTTGLRTFVYGPRGAVTGNVTAYLNTVIPSEWYVTCSHGDGTSYTYSLAAVMLR